MYIKARQYRGILAVGIGLLHRIDMIEAPRAEACIAGGFLLCRCQFRQLDASSLQRLSYGAAGGQTHSFSPFAPFDEVAAVRQRTPVALAVGLSENRFQDPTLAGFELFEKIDVRHRAL